MGPIKIDWPSIIDLFSWLFSLIAIVLSIIALSGKCKCDDKEILMDVREITTIIDGKVTTLEVITDVKLVKK